MELIEFLTSKEIIVIYIVAAVACLLCFIIYLVEKHNDRGRKRHNTKELNKLVEQIKEEVDIEEVEEVDSEPVLEIAEEVNKAFEETIVEPEILEPINSIEEADIEYTTIEPDLSTAKEELHKITEELKQQDSEEINVDLTTYEVEQEENAIISLEELVKKSKEMYEANELTQYKDEGNEPISIKELEARTGKEATPVTEQFVISNVVKEDELESSEMKVEAKEEAIKDKVVLDDFNTIKVNNIESEVKRFKSSPIISPIYGIEKKENINEIELENTADYDKLDEEIKKTNEFLMTLKELQSKLD